MLETDMETELNELDALRVARVDYVALPANRRRFLLTKAGRPDQKEASMATTFVEDLAGVTEKIKKTLLSGNDELKQETETLISDIKTAVEDQSVEFAEADIAKALKELDAALNTETISKESVAAYHTQVKELLAKATVKKEEKEEKDPTEVALAKAGLTDEQLADIKAVLKADAVRVEKADKERETRIQKAEAEATAARSEIKKMQNDAEHRSWVEKATKQWSHLALSAADLGQLFMDLSGIEGVVKDKLVALLDSADEQVKKSKFFDELGSSIPSSDSPEGKVEALAKERVTKSAGKTSMIEAQAEIWKENPELLKEFEANKVGA